jgi:hypothetical protein
MHSDLTEAARKRRAVRRVEQSIGVAEDSSGAAR